MTRNTLLVLATLLCAASPASAQRTGAAMATIRVPTLLRIDVSHDDVVFPEPTLDDFVDGFVLATSEPARVRTRGNVPHRVQITATTPTLDADAPDADAKPIEDLHWSADGLAWTPLVTSPADVLLLPAGRHPEAALVRFRLRLALETDAPATYHAVFVFTAVAQ